jgi:hypothetical protein
MSGPVCATRSLVHIDAVTSYRLPKSRGDTRQTRRHRHSSPMPGQNLSSLWHRTIRDGNGLQGGRRILRAEPIFSCFCFPADD